MITEAALLTIDIWTPIVWTGVFFTFDALILCYCVVTRSGGVILGLFLLLLRLSWILI